MSLARELSTVFYIEAHSPVQFKYAEYNAQFDYKDLASVKVCSEVLHITKIQNHTNIVSIFIRSEHKTLNTK